MCISEFELTSVSYISIFLEELLESECQTAWSLIGRRVLRRLNKLQGKHNVVLTFQPLKQYTV